MTDKRQPRLYCSFCGRDEQDVFMLIAGPRVFICDTCAALCCELAATRRAAMSSQRNRLLQAISARAAKAP